MITYSTGSLFDADVQALVNPVNCVGTMGRGLALQFKTRFPGAFQAYGHACAAAALRPGAIFTFEEKGKLVFHFPTKRHWRDSSRLVDITAGLSALRSEVVARGVTSLAIPALGCGLGGLAWVDVKPRIEAAFKDLDGVTAVVFPPQD